MNLKAVLLATMFLISPLALADFEYHGFSIDDRLLDGDEKANFAARGAPKLIEQLVIVESAGLPPDMLEFFKKTKILIEPGLRGQPGIFTMKDGEGLVTVRPAAFSSDRPVLLHELLHAYHFHALPRHPAILEGFAAASRPGVYPPQFQRSHFLENPKEFFAVTGTIYLVGQIQQPPFNCKGFAQNDPAYLAFLEKTFGRRECR